MKEKVFNLHIAYHYALGVLPVVDKPIFKDTVYEFKEGDCSKIETELSESGMPMITPEILDAIRSELKQKHGVDELTILSWQWYDWFSTVIMAQTNLSGPILFFLAFNYYIIIIH